MRNIVQTFPLQLRRKYDRPGRSQHFIGGGNTNLLIETFLHNLKIEKIVLLISKLYKMFCKLFIYISIILESFASL